MKIDRKINVVHVTQYLEIGGLESFIVEFSKQIDKDAFQVSVLCLNGCNDNYRQSLEQSCIPVHLITKRSKYDLKFFLKAAAFLKENNTDILHSHGGCFLYSTIIGKLGGIKKIIYTAHGMPVTFGLKARIEEFLACLLAHKIIAVSDEIAYSAKARVGVFDKKIETITNGINQHKFSPCSDSKTISQSKLFFGLPENKKIIGSVGRLESVKNYPLLLKALAEVIHSYKNDVHLVLVGEGSKEDELKALAEELSIAGNVSFLGMQYDLPRIYPLFDIFGLSSLTEGTSISLLEAQSCGIPAVVTDVGGNSNVITDGVNGLLCPSGDHAAMASKLDYLLKDDAALLKMKTAARQAVLRGFDMDSMVEKYQSIYCGWVVPDKSAGLAKI
jgi:glycosyltransferase involved in cell wall biosynthesis